jgi:hypothetical protein
MDSVVALAVHGPAAPAARDGAKILGEIRARLSARAPAAGAKELPDDFATPELAAFRLGRYFGVFSPDENLALRRFGIRLDFPGDVLEVGAGLAAKAGVAGARGLS